MRFTSTFSALAAFTALAQAGPVLDERGTYEQPGVISVGDYYSDTTSTIDMAMPMAGGYQSSVTPQAVAANVVPTMASSAAAPSKTQYVVVGGTAGLVYTPEYIFAEIGEVVIFHFGTKNHTFTQSTFPQPCVAMSNGKPTSLSR
jgi:plastocyanin